MKFRASQAYLLLNSGRSKSEVFGQTAKKYFIELYIEKKYGRIKRQLSNKFFDKGNRAEEDSITLLSKHDMQFYRKNEQSFENEFFTGTPDIITDNEIIDIKTPFDIFTFYEHKQEPLVQQYQIQLLVYMALTGRKKSRLAYCLVDTPNEIAERETKWWTQQDWDRHKNLFTYSDIDKKERVFTVEYNFDEELYYQLVERAQLANEFIKSLG